MSIDDMTTCIFAKGIQHQLKQQRELNRAKRVTVFRDPREDRGNNLSSLEKKKDLLRRLLENFPLGEMIRANLIKSSRGGNVGKLRSRDIVRRNSRSSERRRREYRGRRVGGWPNFARNFGKKIAAKGELNFSSRLEKED